MTILWKSRCHLTFTRTLLFKYAFSWYYGFCPLLIRCWNCSCSECYGWEPACCKTQLNQFPYCWHMRRTCYVFEHRKLKSLGCRISNCRPSIWHFSGNAHFLLSVDSQIHVWLESVRLHLDRTDSLFPQMLVSLAFDWIQTRRRCWKKKSLLWLVFFFVVVVV